METKPQQLGISSILKSILLILKSDFAKVVYFILIIFACFLIPNIVGRCSVHKPVFTDNTQHVIDSVNQLYRAKERLKLDSIDKVSAKKISLLKTEISIRDKKINILKAENETLIDAYENDPDLSKCDSIVESQKQIIKELDLQIEDIGAEAEHYSNMLYSSQQKIVFVEVDKAEAIKELKIKEATIQDLYKQLTKNQKKYKFWKSVLQIVAVVEAAIIVVK